MSVNSQMSITDELIISDPIAVDLFKKCHVAIKQPGERNKITSLLQGAAMNVDSVSCVTIPEFLTFKHNLNHFRPFLEM